MIGKTIYEEGRKLGVLDDDGLVAVHEELIKQQDEDIKELKKITFGLPQILESFDKTLTKLSNNLEKFLDNADKKYQTKEVCEVCSSNIEKRVDKLETEKERMKWWIIGLLVASVGELLAIIANLYGINAK